MAEYIEREAVLKEIDERISNLAFYSPYQEETHVVIEGMERARDSVEDAPVADVVPVVHGKWSVLRINGLVMGVNCSECHTTWDANSNYYPNCGARMDGE